MPSSFTAHKIHNENFAIMFDTHETHETIIYEQLYKETRTNERKKLQKKQQQQP